MSQNNGMAMHKFAQQFTKNLKGDKILNICHVASTRTAESDDRRCTAMKQLSV